MKIFSTSFFYAKALALSFFFCLPLLAIGQVLFTQDFSAGGTLSTYIGSSSNQFDYIGPSGSAPASTIYFQSSALQFQRGNTGVAFARTTDLSPTPSVLKVKFKLFIPFSTVSAGNMATFYVGSGFATNAMGEVSANQHSRVTLSFPTASGTFQLRNTVSPITNSPEYTGTQDITWYINNSDAAINYTDPAGGSTSLANDFADVWVGTTRVLTNAAITGTQTLTDFKFLFNNGSGAVRFDNIEISTGINVLPISLLSFNANKAGTANKLAWATATESNNKGFDVERQTATGAWETLGFVKGIGSAATYKFEDKAPLSISYYRLRQVDFDGKETLSKVVSVSQDKKGSIKISPNPVSDKVRIVLSENNDLESTIITVYDLMGKQVMTEKTTADALELDMSSLAKGIYMLKIDTNSSSYTEKIIRQ